MTSKISLKHASLLISISMLAGCAVSSSDVRTVQNQENQPDTQDVSSDSIKTATDVAKAWGFDESDLPPDPDVRYGVLPNGMRYALRHNDTPKDSAVVRFAFDIGSVAEEDDQRGLAHFIEHMAFNGTTNVPEGEMVKILERYGLAFGADTNASTGFDRTMYTLDLPNVEPELVDTALFLMRETASEILFDPEAIDRERGVILSELRTRDSYSLRSFENRIKFLVPDAKIVNRLPIGTKEVIENAPAQRFRDFYDRYYTPGRATLVIVGDIDVDAIEAQIKEKFSDWSAKNGEIPDPDYGSVDLDRTDLDNEYSDPALGESVNFVMMSPYIDRGDTIEERQQNLLRSIGYNIIGRRLGRAIRSENAPFTSARIGSSDLFELARQTTLTVSAKDGQLAEAVAAAEKIVRTALTYGFTDAEIAEQLANTRNAQENAVKAANTRRSSSLASALISASQTDGIVTTPQSSLDRFNAFAPTITADKVLEALRSDIVDLDKPLVHVTSKTGVEGGPAAIRAAYLSSRAQPVAKPEMAEIGEFAYQDFGAPGSIAKDGRIEDLGIRTITFDNNVRLNIKRTDFEDDRVRISLRIDGGEMLNTVDAPYSTSLMNIYDAGGLEAHSVDDLLTLFAGRSISLNFGGGTEYFGSYLVTTPKDAALQMQVLAAYATAPGYRTEALDRYRRSLPNFYARLNATPGSALSYSIGKILSDNDPRFVLGPQEIYKEMDFDMLRDAVSERLSNGAIEIGIVGDIDEQTAIDMVASTFGALPEREAEFKSYDENRNRSFTADLQPRRVYHDGEENQAIVQIYWPTVDGSDFKREAAHDLLASILQLRLTEKLREELGATYSYRSSSFNSSVYPGYGHLSVGGNVEYSDIDRVYAAVMEITRELGTNPPTQDEMDRARKPILERITKGRRENSRWIGITDEAQSDLDSLDRFRSAESVLSSVTANDVMQVARQYLTPDRALRVEVVHRSKEQASE